MGWTKLAELYCDMCGELYAHATTVTELREDARKEGWKCGKKDTCPDCQKKNKGAPHD